MKKIYKEANKSETETTVNVLYQENKLLIYTNKVDLQKQLNKLIGEPNKEYITKIKEYDNIFNKIKPKKSQKSIN